MRVSTWYYVEPGADRVYQSPNPPSPAYWAKQQPGAEVYRVDTELPDWEPPVTQVFTGVPQAVTTAPGLPDPGRPTDPQLEAPPGGDQEAQPGDERTVVFQVLCHCSDCRGQQRSPKCQDKNPKRRTLSTSSNSAAALSMAEQTKLQNIRERAASAIMQGQDMRAVKRLVATAVESLLNMRVEFRGA